MKLLIKESDNKKLTKERLNDVTNVRINDMYITKINNIRISCIDYDSSRETLDFAIDGNIKAKGDIVVKWHNTTAKLDNIDMNITWMYVHDINKNLVNYNRVSDTIAIDNKLKEMLMSNIYCDLSYTIDYGEIDNNLLDDEAIVKGNNISAISFALSNQEQIDELNYQYEDATSYYEYDDEDDYSFV